MKDAHDRFANLQVSYLLARMEAFKGLAILATNRKKDLDEAFMRRLRYVVVHVARHRRTVTFGTSPEKYGNYWFSVHTPSEPRNPTNVRKGSEPEV